MNAYLIYSKDPFLAEIFLESQILKNNPKQVLRYSFKTTSFKEIASRIFNFSLFGDKNLYFLENVEVLKVSEISFLARLDYNQLQDIFIFYLDSKIYWKLLPRWENIKGLQIRELKFPLKSSIKNYLERKVAKTLSPEALNYIMGVYQKVQNFNEIMDAVLNASLYYPETQEIDVQILQEFLESKEPSEIRYLYQSLKQRELKISLGTIYSLKKKGYKEEKIFLSLISKLAQDSTPEETEFLLDLERKFKIGKGHISFILLQLVFFYCQPEALEYLQY